MPKLLVVLFNFKGSKTAPNDRVEGVLDGNPLVKNWLRHAPNQYIVSFEGDAEQLFQLLKPLIHIEDYLLILETTVAGRRGWSAKIVVDWFKKFDL